MKWSSNGTEVRFSQSLPVLQNFKLSVSHGVAYGEY